MLNRPCFHLYYQFYRLSSTPGNVVNCCLMLSNKNIGSFSYTLEILVAQRILIWGYQDIRAKSSNCSVEKTLFEFIKNCLVLIFS